MTYPVTNYAVKLKIGEKDLTPYLDRITIETLQDNFMQEVILFMHITRNNYEKDILPNKDAIELEIITSKGCDAEGTKIPDIDASFAYKLAIISEDRTLSTVTITEETAALDNYVFRCVSQKILKPVNALIMDKCFYNKTREDMFSEITGDAGADTELQSDIFEKSAVIEQCFIPPGRIIHALRHINYYFNLFEGGNPVYFYFGIDGKLYAGSCIKNKMEPLSIYLGGDRESWQQANAVRSASSEEYRYVMLSVSPERDYSLITSITGTRQNYTFSPMNRLFSRVTKSLNEYDTELLSNTFGDNPLSTEAIKRMTSKERWMNAHNGLATEETGEDNNHFINSYLNTTLGKSTVLSGELEGLIKFEEILHIGRRIKLGSARNTSDFAGDYYLDGARFDMMPVGNKTYWTGKASIIIKSGIKLKNF